MTHTSRTRRIYGLGLLGLVAALATGIGLTVAPAGAIDDVKPTPCAGVHFGDAEGDQVWDPNGLAPGGSGKAPDNMDITSVFLNYRPGTDGKPVLTVNIEIKNLTKAVPTPQTAPAASGGIYYYAHWAYKTVGEAPFVKAVNRSGGNITYHFGYVDPNGAYFTEGTTKGAFFEGEKGIVQIDVPEAIGGKPGETLKGLIGMVDTIEGADDTAGFNHHADEAPEGPRQTPNDMRTQAPNGLDYTVVECPAAPPPGDGGGTPPPGGGGTPPPSGGGGGTTQPGGAGSTTPGTGTGATLPFSVGKSLGSARKAKKGKSLRLKARAGKAITNLSLQLKNAKGKGGALATGKVSQLKQGASTVKIKLKKKLKKGKYRLIATGVVDGKTLTVSLAVSVKR